MKNIYLLPTGKASRLWKNNLLQGKLELSKNVLPFNTSQHIYITSDEIIKKGDWCIEFTPNNEKITELFKCNEEQVLNISTGTDYKYKKVILTTHPDLIKDGVQEIDDEFLEWFVKNPSCEKVDVKYNYVCSNCNEDKNNPKYKTCHGNYRTHILFKIIIPKEEDFELVSICEETIKLAIPMIQDKEDTKQETLEEAAERLYPTTINSFTDSGFDTSETERLIFKNGAKWQQEQIKNMYSEEEVRKMFSKYNEVIAHRDIEEWQPWIDKQFKKNKWKKY